VAVAVVQVVQVAVAVAQVVQVVLVSVHLWQA
jgi:hypothetical protein